jgi:zinc protease
MAKGVFMRYSVVLLIATVSCLVDLMATEKIYPSKYFIDDLPNGLRVVTVPTDFPHLAAFWVVVQAGSRDEVEPGKSGFAHFFEHMMFRGTEDYTNEQYEELLKNAGADGNAFTSDDYTAYHITHSKEDLELIVKLEASRFQRLKYSKEDFRTEAKAVLGEYNKNSSNPLRKMIEVLRDKAFDKHTYKHTTMGFLKDIEDMPNQYEYSLKFFSRFYRPERATILLAGDVDHERALSLVKKYWSGWKRGDYVAQVPQEPKHTGPRTAEIAWPSETLPWILIAHAGPAFSDETKDMPAADLISSLTFSESSDLYQKLVIREQKVDALLPMFEDHKDPYLLAVAARVKNPADIVYVQDEILKAIEAIKVQPVQKKRLENVKSNLKYSLALRMDSSEAIAEILSHYIQLRRTPEALNQVYRVYDTITSEDIMRVASRYFVPEERTIVTLRSGGNSER